MGGPRLHAPPQQHRPAGRAPADATRHVEAVLALSGDTNPIEVLRGSPAWMRDRIARVPPDAFQWPELPAKWSVGELPAHPADAEVVWVWRLR